MQTAKASARTRNKLVEILGEELVKRIVQTMFESKTRLFQQISGNLKSPVTLLLLKYTFCSENYQARPTTGMIQSI